MKNLLLACFILLQATGLWAQKTTTTSPAQDPGAYFQSLKWRNIGPFRGGRSVAACGIVGDPLTYYMGSTGGGLWKTEDAGQVWTNVSDGYFKTGSVGAVEVSESDPQVVYCGMGEHAVRGVMTSYGDGMYKSTDGGKTWRKIGLELTQHISRIAIHPKNPDIVYVAAQGALYGPTKDRGIYKSTDGGASWTKVLFVDEHTGCAELSMDMTNPQVLYAAMWEHGRLPWQVISGGPGSGLYKSTDAGVTWNKIHTGLPDKMGKMAISVCRSNPEKVYALIESDSDKEMGGLFVSENAGKSWSRVSNDHQLVQRAWYYIKVFADPQNENTVYVMSAPALRSIDGGKTWETLTAPHGDFHNLWLNPRNSRNMVIANDGGASITFNYGKTWSTQDNMPTAQFYRVNADNRFPYRLYGGQQDNSSVVIAHREFNNNGIGQHSWTYSAGGESAFLAFDPDDPSHVLGGSYQGTIDVLTPNAEAGTNIMAAPNQYLTKDAKDMKYRFNWNAPIIWSKHEPGTFYHGAQLLLRTRDLGLTWEEASPDLTRNEKAKQGTPGVPYTNEAVGAENYGTLSYIAESPSEKGVIWTGSDDGLVHLTRDGGAHWQNVTPTGLAECLINAIEVSPHDPAIAYIATTRYKFNDYTPGLYKTTDYGKTWTNISTGIPYGAFTRVVREDTQRKDLLFAGTETGIYISWNGGKQWNPFQLNFPVTPVTDLMVKNTDLLAATSGRAFWILDDLGPLRQYDPDKKGLVLYQPEDAILANGSSALDKTSAEFTGTNPLQGVNPANGIVIYYQLQDTSAGALTLEIKDSNGKLVRSFTSEKDSTYQEYEGAPPADPVLSKNKGLNRFVWNMRYPTMVGVPNVYLEAGFRGHKASPGNYSITLKKGAQEATASFKILPNPSYATGPVTYDDYNTTMMAMETELSTMHKMINTLAAVRKQIDDLVQRLPADATYEAVKKEGKALSAKLVAWDEDMIQRKSKAYDDAENFPNKFTAQYIFLINQTESDIPRVNTPSRQRMEELNKEWAVLKARADKITSEDIPAYNQALWKAGIGGVWMPR